MNDDALLIKLRNERFTTKLKLSCSRDLTQADEIFFKSPA